MAIKGSLREASLPDVIQLLALGRKTGCLAVTDRHNFGTIYFQDGRITYATIVNRRDRLGDLLLKNGVITPDQLAEALRLQGTMRHQRIGSIMVAAGFLSLEQLRRFTRLQIEEAVYTLFTWNSGTFNFDPGVRPEGEDVLVDINPESLLLEGARRVDEWELIAKKVASFDLVFALDRAHLEAAGVELSPEQRRLLPHIDGRRDVRQLVEESGLVEFEAARALYGLVTAGFAHRVGTTSAAVPRASDSRVDEHRNLGIAFYRTGMWDDARREFRRVAELRPAQGHAPFHLGLVAMRQGRWQEAVELLREAAEKGGPRVATLHNLGLALARLGRLADAEAAHAEAVSRAPADPRVVTAWGMVALRGGDVAAARARLAQARTLLGPRIPEPAWWWAASLAAAAAGALDEAIALAHEGLAAYPGQAVLANNLAVLHELQGDLGQAESLLRTAAANDPALPQAAKNLGDLAYRSGRHEEAMDAYERATRSDPGLGDDVFFRLGNLAFKQGDRARARASWERALALNPAHRLASANLAMLEPMP